MFKVYADPGHAWVAVKIKVLEDLNIADKITAFSYVKGQTAYLEEDCDLSLFVKAYEEKYGQRPAFAPSKWTNGRCRVRSYAAYARGVQ